MWKKMDFGGRSGESDRLRKMSGLRFSETY